MLTYSIAAERAAIARKQRRMNAIRIFDRTCFIGCIVTFLVMMALLLAATAAHAQTVTTARPRLLLAPADLANLKAKAAANSAPWRALKSACDGYLGSIDPYDVSIPQYALAYQVTGDTRYSSKAIQLMEAKVALGLAAVTRDSGYDARSTLPALALGYDWCYDRMTIDQRSRIRAGMEADADWVWPETNPARADGWAVRFPGNNYHSGFLATWMIGLALSGDSPKAANYITQARRRWQDEVLPYLAKYGKGGWLLDGSNYGPGSAYRWLLYLAAHKSATGEDLIQGFAWPGEWVQSKLAVTMPDMRHQLPSGDQSRVSDATFGDLDRSSVLVALATCNLPAAITGPARTWLDTISVPVIRNRADQWQEFLFSPEDVPATPLTAAHGSSFHPSAGIVTMRSGTGWGPADTVVTFQCGARKEDHQDLAQGEINIWRQGWLAAPARVWSSSGLYQETLYHNTLLLGTQGQVAALYSQARDGARVIRTSDTADAGFVEGECAVEYSPFNPLTPALRQMRRRVLYVKPDRVLVMDDVDATNPALAKKALLHVPTEPTFTGGWWQVNAVGSALRVKPLLPSDGVSSTTRLSLGSNGSWRLDWSTPGGRTRDRLLQAMWVGSEAAVGASPDARIVPNADTNILSVAFGDTQMTFDDRASDTALTLPGAAPRQVIVTTWAGQLCRATGVLAGGTTATVTARADAAGVLTVTLPSTPERLEIALARDIIPTPTPVPPVPPTPIPTTDPTAVTYTTATGLPPSPGEHVRILGAGFGANPGRIYYGPILLAVVSWSDTAVEVELPALLPILEDPHPILLLMTAESKALKMLAFEVVRLRKP